LSRQSINEYRAELDRLRAVSGSRRESVLREAFKDLLKRWGRGQELTFVPEHDIVTPQKNRIYLFYGLLTGDDYTHGAVKHGAKEYAHYDYRSGETFHVNTAEGF